MNKRLYFISIFIFILFYQYNANSQGLNAYEFNRGSMRIMFYNVENLYDIFNDSLKNDDNYTPEGERYWTKNRYQDKLNKISKVITAIGQWEMPEIIGLCEIENRYVLEDLIQKTVLKEYSYNIIHKDSPDKRGIDVGFLYRKDKFKPIEYDAFEINFPFNLEKKTRDILYVKGKTNSGDTLHFFINHWPSRYGGELETDKNRRFVAQILRSKVDSLFRSDINPKIIIMGDLNDYPTNKSVTEVLKANISTNKINNEDLYNLSYDLQENKNKGTHKYGYEWGILDQFIVSGSLLNNEGKIYLTKDDIHVFDAPYLLETDNKFVGFKTKRTYVGYTYNGGFSDHLPIYIDLFKNNIHAK